MRIASVLVLAVAVALAGCEKKSESRNDAPVKASVGGKGKNAGKVMEASGE